MLSNGSELRLVRVVARVGALVLKAVAADRDQMFDAERREVCQRLLGGIPGLLPPWRSGRPESLGRRGEPAACASQRDWFGWCAAR
jgi:hypothetical protein